MRRLVPAVLLGLTVTLACTDEASDTPSDAARGDSPAPHLGPADRPGLPPADLERVAVGDTAPDFSLASWRGDTLTLSEVRGEKEILLVFYRGHW